MVQNNAEENRIKEKLGFSAEVRCFDAIDSTNDEAKRIVKQKARGTFLICANEQTNGRGRRGKSFYSPAETGIYMTLAVYPCSSVWLGVTAAAAVAVCRAIEDMTALKPEIKWVNDIYIKNKKVCGILCEAVSFDIDSAVIIGIGVNVSTISFPSEVENGGSLGVELDRAELIAKIANGLNETLNSNNAEYMDYYRAHSMLIGKKINIIKNNAVRIATATGIDGSGGLTVRYENGQSETLTSTQVTVREE